jgi:hypothetical protein
VYPDRRITGLKAGVNESQSIAWRIAENQEGLTGLERSR